MQSPCLTCPKANDPQECPLIKCSEWRGWFINWWNKMRASVLAEKQHREIKGEKNKEDV